MKRVCWLLASVCVLVATLYLYDPKTGRDADVILVYGMLLLAFPSGFLVAASITMLASVEESTGVPLINADYGQGTMAFIWFCFVVVGYLQWFKALPWLVEKWHARRANSATPPI